MEIARVLYSKWAVDTLGARRLPCWALLSAGVVVRAHACTVQGDRYMTFAEAALVIPRLIISPAARKLSKAAWEGMVASLEAMGIPPVPQEQVVDAYSIWRGQDAPLTVLCQQFGTASQSGSASTGDRGDLDALIARLERGDEAAAAEWEAAYTQWARSRPPPPQQERELPAATPKEMTGVHIRYIMPGAGGTRADFTTGSPPQIPLGDGECLAEYARQRWQIDEVTLAVRCALDTPLDEASVVVQLFARAIPLAVEAWEASQEAKRAKR